MAKVSLINLKFNRYYQEKNKPKEEIKPSNEEENDNGDIASLFGDDSGEEFGTMMDQDENVLSAL
jgi:hypothetical protein